MKRPQGASKGIVVLTRAEVQHVLDDLRLVRHVLSALREQYLVAVAESWSRAPVGSAEWVDFHFTPKGAVCFEAPGTARILPFDASSFIPAYFRPRGGDPQWDVVAVTQATEGAHVDHMLKALRELKDRRPQTRAMIFCRAPGTLASPGTLSWVLEQYRRDFTSEGRDDIALVVLHPQSCPMPLPMRDLAWIYGACRAYLSFDTTEQSPVAAKQALLAGLPIVVHRECEGGVVELAEPTNSRLFGTVDEAVQGLLELLDMPGRLRFDTTSLARSSSETHTVPQLLDALRKLYQDLALPFDGEVDTSDLCSKLSQSMPTLPPGLDMAWGHQVSTPTQMLERLKQLVMETSGSPPLGPLGMLQAELDCRRRTGQVRARSLFGQARRMFKRATP